MATAVAAGPVDGAGLCRRRLRAGGGLQPGLGRRRHQDLPLPGPEPPAGPRPHPVGRRPGPGHRHPPEHRLPVADGALLLAGREPGPARLAGPAAVAGDAAGRGRPRSAVSAALPGLGGPGAADRGPGLPAQPLSAALLGPDLDSAGPLGRVGLADRAHRAGRPDRRMALPGPVRLGRGHGRKRQRHQPGAGRAGPGAVAGPRGVGSAQRLLEEGRGRRRPHRGAHRRGVAVVDGRAGRPGGLQPAGHPLHRELQGGGRRQHRPRDPARARLLVLLRQRQARRLDRAQRGLHPGPLAGVRQLRSGGGDPGAGLGPALEPPRLLLAPAGRRRPDRGGGPSLGRPVAGRGPVQGVHPHRRRPGPAVHPPGRPAGGAVGGGAGRGRRQRPSAAHAPARRGGRRRGAAGRGAQQPGHVEGPHGGGAPAPPRGPAGVLAGGGRRPGPGRAGPGVGGARLGLRLLPVGQHRGPDHPRPDRPGVRGPGAGPLRLASIGGIAHRGGPAPPGADAGG